MAVLPFGNLPLGFRFRPTDVELIDHYLRLKINGNDKDVSVIREVDVCKVEPWDLPDLSIIQTADPEWFFFCPRDRKYPNGQRANRATGKGYWKATGKDRRIVSRTMGLIGMKKTLVFYMGRAPKGKRTHWVIHEYRTTLKELDGAQPGQGAFVLCRLFKKHEDKKQTDDDDDEGSNCDQVEAIVCSPTATNLTSPGELQSDASIIQQSPVSCGQSIENAGTTDNKVAQVLKSESVVAAQSHSNSYNICDEEVFNKGSTPEVNSEIEDVVKYFYVPETPFPLHSGPGASIMDQIDTAGFDVAPGAMHFQNVDSDNAISEFLDSVLNNPDDYSWNSKMPFIEGFDYKSTDGMFFDDVMKKEGESCSGSDVEGAQLQNDVALTNSSAYHKSLHAPVGNVHLVQPHPYADDDWFSEAALDQFCNPPSSEEGSICTENSNPDQQYNTADHSGIKIRQRPRAITSLSTNRVDQGTANRRICLQMSRGMELQSRAVEPLPIQMKPLVNDGESPPSEDAEESSQVSKESGVHPVPKGTGRQKTMKKAEKKKNMDGKKGIKFVFFSHRFTPLHVIGVALLVIMSLVFVCLWRAPQIPRYV